jgi:hypothetical protein
MAQRATAACVAGNDDFDPMSIQKTDGSAVDSRIQRLLYAALKKKYAHTPLTDRGMNPDQFRGI